MKRLILFVALFVGFFTGNAQNPKFTSVSPSGHTLSYEIYQAGHAWVTCEESHSMVHFYGAVAYTNLSGAVIVPDSVVYNGMTYPVDAIGNRAFSRCQNITSITLPTTITFLDWYSFEYSNVDTIISLSETAPELRPDAFLDADTNAIVIVPCGSQQSYIDEWGSSFIIQCPVQIQFNLIITQNDITWGTGSYLALSDSIAEITATASYGYHFDHWSYGSTFNPDTIMLTNDDTITAFFAKNQYSVTGTANDSIRGYVTGSATVEYLDTVTLTATAHYGYQFVRWNDYSIQNPRRVAATANITKTAIFNFVQYSITVQSDTSIHGTCSGGGSYNYLSQRNIQANANYGYHFTQWSDGNTDNPRVITLTQDTIFTAMFEKNNYIVTVQSDDTARGYAYGGDTVPYLDSVVVMATFNYGYHFTRWQDYNTNNPRQIQVTQNKTYTAFFDCNQYTITLNADTAIHGTVTGAGNYNYLSQNSITATANYGYHFTQWNDGDTNNPRVITLTQDTAFVALFAKNTYTLTLLSNDTSLGVVSGSTVCEYLDTVTINATSILSHYHFVRWSDGGVEATRDVVVTCDSLITAIFAIDTHSVTLLANNNDYGTVNGACSVPYGTDVTVAATATDGYHFAEWNNGSRENPYTITVTGDTLLTAIFTDDVVTQICMVSVQDGHNVVVWEQGLEVTAYNIYRESSVTDVYELVASIPYDSIPLWVDTASRPAVHSYRYRMTATDIYGYESEPSNIHKTMHLTISQGIGNRWNLVWTEYEGASYTTYVIYRGTNTGNIQQIDVMAAGGNTTYTDENAPEGDVYYQVGVMMSTPCNSTKTSSISLSNIATNGSTEGIQNIVDFGNFRVYSEYGEIVVEGVLSRPVQVFDMMGRTLYTTANNSSFFNEHITIPVSSSGIYLVKIGDYPARKVVVVK